MSSNATQINTDIVSKISLATRSVLEVPLDEDDTVDKVFGIDVDINWLFRDFPMQQTGDRTMPLSIPTIAKERFNKAFESTEEIPGSSAPYTQLSMWQMHVYKDGDLIEPDKLFQDNYKDATPFSDRMGLEILEMTSFINDTANVTLKPGDMIAKWIDTDGSKSNQWIAGNTDSTGAVYKNFLHSFANSAQLEDLLRSSVAMGLYTIPQPNRMVSGGMDSSEDSIALLSDSLDNREDFTQVFPKETAEGETARWTSFLKLRENDVWMFKLQLSVHDDSFANQDARTYRFMLRQKDSVPASLTYALNDNHAAGRRATFTLAPPEQVPNKDRSNYMGSLTSMGIELQPEPFTGESATDHELLVDPNSVFHTGEALKLDKVDGQFKSIVLKPNDDTVVDPLLDMFLCALIPVNAEQIRGLTRPIFAACQSAIKEKGEIGVIHQIHPIQDMEAQLARYLSSPRCLVVPMVDWFALKPENAATSGSRPDGLIELMRPENYTKYPTCTVRVQAGSGVEFELTFDAAPNDDPNTGDINGPEDYLVSVTLVQGGSGYLGNMPPPIDHHTDEQMQQYYMFSLADAVGDRYYDGIEGTGPYSFSQFMNKHFKVNSNGNWVETATETTGNPIPYTDGTYRRITKQDPAELQVVLVQGDRVCQFVSMSEKIRVPLFHNHDIQGDGTQTAIEDTSFSPYSHPFQTVDEHNLLIKPIRQVVKNPIEIEWPPYHSTKHLDPLNNNDRRIIHTILDNQHQYKCHRGFLEMGGFGERGNRKFIKSDEEYTNDAFNFFIGNHGDIDDYLSAQENFFPKFDAKKEDATGDTLQKCIINHRYRNNKSLVLILSDIQTSQKSTQLLLPLLSTKDTDPNPNILLKVDLVAPDEGSFQAIPSGDWPDYTTSPQVIYNPEGNPLMDVDYNLSVSDYQADLIAILTANATDYIASAVFDEIGNKLTIYLKDEYSFQKLPVIYESGNGDGYVRIAGYAGTDDKESLLEFWPFLASGIEFVKKDSASVALDPNPTELPRFSIVDGTMDTRIKIELVDIDPTSEEPVEVNLPHAGKLKVNLFKLRQLVHNDSAKYTKIYRDYDLQFRFYNAESNNNTTNVIDFNSTESYLEVDEVNKVFRFHFKSETKDENLGKGDTSSILIYDFNNLLAQIVSSIDANGIDVSFDGGLNKTTYTQAGVLSITEMTANDFEPSSTSFLSATEPYQTYSYDTSKIDLEYRWYDIGPREELKTAATNFENNAEEATKPLVDTITRFDRAFSVDDVLKTWDHTTLQSYFANSGASSAQYLFYGEIAVQSRTEQNGLQASHLVIEGDIKLQLTLCDRNLCVEDTLAYVEPGTMHYVNYEYNLHGSGAASQAGPTNLLHFEEAQTGTHGANVARDFVLRAYAVDTNNNKNLKDNFLITYNKQHLFKSEGDDEQPAPGVLPLVSDAQQGIVPQLKITQL